jgi:hypothetical protein
MRLLAGRDSVMACSQLSLSLSISVDEGASDMAPQVIVQTV